MLVHNLEHPVSAKDLMVLVNGLRMVPESVEFIPANNAWLITAQVRDVLASQCLAMAKPRLRQVRVDGTLAPGVYAKDVILTIIRRLGVKGGVGYAYEYAGSVIERMTMEERLTVCNMSIEGGARFGYINPDDTTVAYLRGRPYAPQGEAFERLKMCSGCRVIDMFTAQNETKITDL